MSIFEPDAKVDELRELRNFESEIKAAISLIEDALKSEMLRRNTDVLSGNNCLVTWKPIRQAIVDEVSARRIEYIRDDRKDSLAPTTLNRFLQAMDLPFRVKKSKKQWEILPQE